MSLRRYGTRAAGWGFALLYMFSPLFLLAQEGGEKGQELSPEPLAISSESSYVYDPTDKRDPFLPRLGMGPGKPACAEELKTPLQSYEVGQLKLVGVIWNLEEPRALVEDSAGMGYIVTPGTAIGSSCGAVKEIKPGRVIVEEYYYDFYGERQTREVLMELAASPEDGEKK